MLTQRNFRWYFVGQCASLLGTGMNSVALSFAVLALTGSPSDLGIVLAAQSASMVAVLLVSGVFADRFPRRLLMVVADASRLLSQGTMAGLLITGHAHIWQLVLLQIVNGTASALFAPASVGLIPTMVASEHLQHANALRALAQSIGSTVGPAVAGILIAATNPGWALAVDAVTYAVSVATLAALRMSARRPAPSQPFIWEMLAGWSAIRSRSWVLGIIVLSASANMLFAVFLVLGPAVAKTMLGGATAWAAIIAAFGTGSVLGGLIALRLRPRYALRAGVIALGLLPLPSIALAAQLPVPMVAGLAAIAGFGATMFNALWETTLQRRIPNEVLSRVSAYDWLASFGCQPLGQATAGPTAMAIGTYPTLWTAGIALLLITAATLAMPSIRSLRSDGTDRRAGERQGTGTDGLARRYASDSSVRLADHQPMSHRTTGEVP